jgi:hypothetical protein
MLMKSVVGILIIKSLIKRDLKLQNKQRLEFREFWLIDYNREYQIKNIIMLHIKDIFRKN